MGSIRKHGQTGALFFDFRYEGARCREYTTLPDTAANKKKMEKVLKMLEADIAAGTFDYRRYFPASKNAARFDAAPAVSVGVIVVAGLAVDLVGATWTPVTGILSVALVITFGLGGGVVIARAIRSRRPAAESPPPINTGANGTASGETVAAPDGYRPIEVIE